MITLKRKMRGTELTTDLYKENPWDLIPGRLDSFQRMAMESWHKVQAIIRYLDEQVEKGKE